MAGLYPLSRMQQFDLNGRPLSGARLFLFNGGTSIPRIGYRDSSLTSAHPNPILADNAGRLPLIYLDDGFYRHRLTTKAGTTVFDDDGLPVVSTTVGGSGTSVDPDSVFKTRDVKIRFDDQPLSGYVRMNGRTIGSASSGATERANADTQSLFEELWTFDNIAVPAGRGASAAADFAANKSLTLPNCQGASLFGMPNMGGTVDTAFAALLSGTTDEPGATAGADTVTVSQANLPAYTLTGGTGTVTVSGTTSTESTNHTHAVTGVTGANSNDHTHPFQYVGGGPTTVQSGTGTNVSSFATTNTNTGGESTTHSHAVNFTSGTQSVGHTHTFAAGGSAGNISMSSGGAGVALNKLPSLLTFMIYLRL
jgi:hypothetical protein